MRILILLVLAALPALPQCGPAAVRKPIGNGQYSCVPKPTVMQRTGTLTSGKVPAVDASGNLVDSPMSCSGGNCSIGTTLPTGAPSGSIGAPVFYSPAGAVNVRAYGAKGDLRSVSDGAIEAGSPTLTSATAAFVAGDVGKKVAVYGAGAAGVTLYSTIQTRNSATSVTLSDNAATTVTGARVRVGTNDSTAIAAAVTAARTGNLAVYVPAGHYFTDTITGLTVAHMTMFGDGEKSSILYSVAGNTIIEITGASVSDTTIRDLGLCGTAGVTGLAPVPVPGNAGHGVYIHDNSYRTFGTALTNLFIFDMGGKCVYLNDDFATRLTKISCYSLGDDGITMKNWIDGVLTQVYVHQVGAAKAAYRIWYGNATLIGCNGVDSEFVQANTDWGVFGRTVAEDGVLDIALPVFIGTNIEGYSRYGVRLKAYSTPSFYGCTWNNYGTNLQAIRFESPDTTGTLGYMDGNTKMFCNNGCTYANSQPIHSSTTVLPLWGKPITAFYDYTDALVISTATPTMLYTAYQQQSYRVSDLSAGTLRVGDATNLQATNIKQLTELTTIAAAATTDTTIQIPAGVLVLGVSVRVTTVIPTAATFTVTGAGSGTTFSTAAVSTAQDTTNPGTAAGVVYNATAQKVRITPNLSPAANSGRVRVTIHYISIGPPTS